MADKWIKFNDNPCRYLRKLKYIKARICMDYMRRYNNRKLNYDRITCITWAVRFYKQYAEIQKDYKQIIKIHRFYRYNHGRVKVE